MTTASAAMLLRVSTRRVVAMIKTGRLPARRDGREWTIEKEALGAIKNRHAGRPRKALISIIEP